MLFKNPVRTSKRTPHFTITKINWLTLFKFKQEGRYRFYGQRHGLRLRECPWTRAPTERFQGVLRTP
jgi:hypothetical protein